MHLISFKKGVFEEYFGGMLSECEWYEEGSKCQINSIHLSFMLTPESRNLLFLAESVKETRYGQGCQIILGA
jgi:hypothetical protein